MVRLYRSIGEDFCDQKYTATLVATLVKAQVKINRQGCTL